MATRLGPGTDVTAIQRASTAATAADPAVDHRHNARLVQKLCATGFAALVLIRTSMACQVPGGGSAEAARLDSGWSCSSQKATACRSSLLIARAAATSLVSCVSRTPSTYSPASARSSSELSGIISHSICSRALDAGSKAANPQAIRDREWRCSISLLPY